MGRSPCKRGDQSLRVSIVEDIAPDAALSKAFEKLEVLQKLKIDFVGTLSGRNKVDAGAAPYQALLKRAASLESLKEFELARSSELIDGQTKTYTSWPSALKRYPSLARKLTCAFVEDAELKEWVGIDMPALREVTITDFEAYEYPHYKKIDAFPGLRKLTVFRMSTAELVTFPLRDLDDLSVELCSFSLARGDAKVILKSLLGLNAESSWHRIWKTRTWMRGCKQAMKATFGRIWE